MVKLFAYGTLQDKKVQAEILGRSVEGIDDTLMGYTLSLLKIKDKKVIDISGIDEHYILKFTGSTNDYVKGKVLKISTEELVQIDDYEVGDYKRVLLKLSSGVSAWVYTA